MIVVLFGVTGSGKTTIGRLLAQELGWKFADGDEFHSNSNVEKMRHGVALTDTDREPWLERLREPLVKSVARGENMVLACSALKEKYRDRLQVGSEIRWVLLKGEYATIANRLRERQNHFMNPDLLQSQFDALEEHTGSALVVDVNATPQEIVQTIRKNLLI